MSSLTEPLRRTSAPLGWRRLRAEAPNLAASLLMVCAFGVFCAMAVLMRLIGGSIPIVEVILVRQVLAFALMAPWFFRHWAEIRRPRGVKLHLSRGVLAVGAMGCGLSATILIPLADATAIQMAEVLFATLFAATILRERVDGRQWAATLIGFAGVGIMVRPFGDGVNPYAFIALFGALCGAGSMIALRMGAAHDRTITVLFWQGLVVLLLVAPTSAVVWVAPNGAQVLTLLGMSLLFAGGQWLFTLAMRLADTAAIAPLGYVRLVMMAALGWSLYGEAPTLATWIGAVLVLGAATYTLSRNARRGGVA